VQPEPSLPPPILKVLLLPCRQTATPEDEQFLRVASYLIKILTSFFFPISSPDVPFSFSLFYFCFLGQVDVWSCGVVVYILLGGYPPFYHDNDAVLFKKIVSGDFEFHAPFWDPVSAAGKDLIRQMLTLNPQERPTAAALLQHPWVTGQAKGQCKASGDLTGAIEQLKRWTAKRRLKVFDG